MLNWKDISSFSHRDTNRETKTVEANAGVVRLVVTRHIDYPGKWVVKSELTGMRELKADHLDEAKAEAVQRVKSVVEKILKSLD